jgi:hypothetical protein
MVLGNTARLAGRVLLAAVLSVGSSGSTAGAAFFAGPRFVKEVSSSPFAAIVTTEIDETDSEWEPHIAVDPTDPSILVAVVQQSLTPYRTIGVATSHDAGRTWTSGSLPGLTAVQGGVFQRAARTARSMPRRTRSTDPRVPRRAAASSSSDRTTVASPSGHPC